MQPVPLGRIVVKGERNVELCGRAVEAGERPDLVFAGSQASTPLPLIEVGAHDQHVVAWFPANRRPLQDDRSIPNPQIGGRSDERRSRRTVNGHRAMQDDPTRQLHRIQCEVERPVVDDGHHRGHRRGHRLLHRADDDEGVGPTDQRVHPKLRVVGSRHVEIPLDLHEAQGRRDVEVERDPDVVGDEHVPHPQWEGGRLPTSQGLTMLRRPPRRESRTPQSPGPSPHHARRACPGSAWSTASWVWGARHGRYRIRRAQGRWPEGWAPRTTWGFRGLPLPAPADRPRARTDHSPPTGKRARGR